MKNVLLLIVAGIASAQIGWAADSSKLYEEKVLPLFQRHCYECHSHASGKAKGGLVLDSRSGLLAGGDLGPAIVPGNPDTSLLIQAVQYGNKDLQMPPKGKLDEKEIALLIEWVRGGASAPESAAAVRKPTVADPALAKKHWAFQPLRKPPVPAVKNSSWSSDPIDRFVLRELEAAGLSPVTAADPQTLIRRLYFDLIGLPPAPAEVEAFTKNSSPHAAEQVVDHLLETPEFGERWGRYWLDVARYADSNGGGSESNNTHDDAWRYRDYVIAAVQEDKPFDRFVTEQIAGDLMDFTSEEQRRVQLIATGFLLLGPKAFGTGDWDQFRLDTVDEQLDTIGKSFLGLAVGCARCHDHKFDPIPTRDYYALAGILSSTASVERAKGWRQGRTWTHVPLPIDPQLEKALEDLHKQQVDQAKEALPKAEAELKKAKEHLAELEKQKTEPAKISEAERAVELANKKVRNARSWPKVVPIVDPVPMAMAVREADKPVDEAIRIRGVPKNQGEKVPRGLLTALTTDDPRQFFAIPTNASGRLQLARWLVDTKHGAGRLLARVTVNRIWGHMLGRPIVPSTENFGITGEKPSHPELLDDLAARFVEEGWSVKRLIRQIALTHVYQLAAVNNAAAMAVDPGNTLLWRHNIRRLDAEAIRDAILAISGQLDRKRGGPTLQEQGLVSFDSDYIHLDGPSPYSRRTVYLPMLRDAIGLSQYGDEMTAMLETFDFADPNVVSGNRSSTTVPTQALFLMNSPFMQEQATACAKRLLHERSTDSARIDYFLRLALGRAPSYSEIDRAANFIRRLSEMSEPAGGESKANVEAWASFCQAVLASNEFLFLN